MTRGGGRATIPSPMDHPRPSTTPTLAAFETSELPATWISTLVAAGFHPGWFADDERRWLRTAIEAGRTRERNAICRATRARLDQAVRATGISGPQLAALCNEEHVGALYGCLGAGRCWVSAPEPELDSVSAGILVTAKYHLLHADASLPRTRDPELQRVGQRSQQELLGWSTVLREFPLRPVGADAWLHELSGTVLALAALSRLQLLSLLRPGAVDRIQAALRSDT